MKIETSREALLGSLRKVSGAIISAGSLNPIEQNVLLSTKGNILTVIAANKEMRIKTTCETKNSENFSTTISAVKLREILIKLPIQSAVTMNFTKSKVKLSAANSVFNLSTLSADNFIQLGEDKEKKESIPAVSAGDLFRVLSYVKYACATQSHRMNLNGILLNMTINDVWLVATDGHRMALERLSESTNKKEIQAILPHKSAAELMRNLSDIETETPVEIDLNQSMVRFSTPSFELVSTLIDQNFPEYKDIIPRNNDKIVKILDRVEFLAALERVAVMGDKGATVIFDLSKNKLKVSCSGQGQDTGQDELAVDYKGSAVEIGFNVSFILDMLRGINENVLQMCLFDSSSSILFHPVDEDSTFRYVVMPIRL